MKTIIAATLLTLSLGAQADQFKTVTEDASLGFANYDAKIAYPKFFSNSIPAFATINEQLKESLLANGCVSGDETQEEVSEFAPHGMSYGATARVVGLNKRYVGIEVNANDYCGGAHPNHYTAHYTFDSNTGSMINMDKEIAAAKYDHADNRLLKVKLSKLILSNIESENRLQDGCYEGLTKSEMLEAIQMDYPMISGLARGKQVIISTSPAHANGPCKEIVRVPYTKVKGLINSGSILHKILK
jgi:hypothetical protein